jgi:hypothetical protein
MQKKSPFIEFFKRGLKIGAFEDYIDSIRKPLKRRGARTDTFSLHIPTPMMCLWTERQRKRLRKRAEGYDAVLVLGCDSATITAQDALKDTDCKIIQGMDMDGIINATAKVELPLTVTLDAHLESIVDVVSRSKTEAGKSDQTGRATP